jgi:hypothetical protein
MFSEPSHPHPTTQNSMEISLRMMLDPNGFKKKKKKVQILWERWGMGGKISHQFSWTKPVWKPGPEGC